MSNNPYPPDPEPNQPANPYAPVTHLGSDPFQANASDVDAFRRAHLSHEASVKSVGCLYYLGAAFGIVAGVFYLAAAALGGFAQADPGQAMPWIILVILGGFMLALGLAQGYIGYGLRRLLPYARIGGIVISAIGLLGFPLGTLISAYILYLLVSHKGEIVFSEQYRHVVEQTPHIQYKTSLIVKILLGVLIAVIVIIIIAAVTTV